MVTQLEPRPLLWPWRRSGGGHIATKLLLSAVVAAVAMRLLISRHIAPPQPASFSSVAAEAAEGKVELNAPIPENASVYEVDFQKEQCNLFAGEWVPDPTGPAYTNETCRFIEEPQNCMRNGRPDTGYLSWRWKPQGCDLPHFDPEMFLSSMQGKTWALIGDSILRNHVQSLICLLSKVEEPIEVYHDETFKSRTWRFDLHNVTLSLLWSPFLIKADVFENDDGVSVSDTELHLDVLDANWTSWYNDFDYVILSTGQWYFKTAIYWESGAVIGCHYCHGKNLTEVEYRYAFRMALRTVYRFVTSAEHKPVVFYRTWTPSHFENGEWWSGGTCNRTSPWRGGELVGNEMDVGMRQIEVEEFDGAVARDGAENAGRLRLLDTFEMSSMRPDGHPGPYRAFRPFDGGRERKKVQNDCLHWCLPGPIDAWNDALMQMLQLAG